MGLFGGHSESSWSAICEELSVDADIVLDNLRDAVAEINDLISACKSLKNHNHQDPAVLENLASQLRSATSREVDELLRNAQSASGSASNLTRIVNGF